MLFLPPAAAPAPVMPFAPVPPYALPLGMGMGIVYEFSKIISRQNNPAALEARVNEVKNITQRQIDFFAEYNQTDYVAEYIKERASQETITVIDIVGTAVIGLVAIALAFRFG